MKMFIVVTVIALLFVIGSALALTAIGRKPQARKPEDTTEGKDGE